MCVPRVAKAQSWARISERFQRCLLMTGIPRDPSGETIPHLGLECGNLLTLWSSATCRRRPPPHYAARLYALGNPTDLLRQVADDQSADTGVPGRAARLGWL